MSEAFALLNGLKQGHSSSKLPGSFTLKYAIRKIQENQEGLKFSGTHQILV
jgi:hypothetical protein